jgi:ribose transport system permease protein
MKQSQNREQQMSQLTTKSPRNGTTNSSTGSRPGPGGAILSWARNNLAGPLGGLIILCLVMSILSPFFFTARNLLNVAGQVTPVAIMAVGATLVVIIGGIDLSVAAVATFSMMGTAALYQNSGWPFIAAVLVGIAVGGLSGLLNGVLITVGRLQPFIATLATMSAAAGLSLGITNAVPVSGFPDWFTWLTRANFVGPLHFDVIFTLLVFAAAAFWLNFRPTGRSLYAIGGNEEVARLAGLPVNRTKMKVYIIAGVLYSLAAILVSSRVGTANPVADPTVLLSVIASVVIGGASLAGGVGTMSGTLVGVLIIGVVNNGLALLNVRPFLQQVILGAVIVIAVLAERFRRRA